MIKESLRGKKIAISGSTGFLGTALVELLLREIDDVQLRLLIRPSGTEPVIRVMVEAENAKVIEKTIDEVCSIFT